MLEKTSSLIASFNKLVPKITLFGVAQVLTWAYYLWGFDQFPRMTDSGSFAYDVEYFQCVQLGGDCGVLPPYDFADYKLVARIFMFFGLNTAQLAGLASLLIITALCAFLLYRNIKTQSGIFAMLIICATCILGSVYCGGYSKEIIIFVAIIPYILLNVFSSKAVSKWRLPIIADVYLVIVLFGLGVVGFRSYYLLIGGLFLVYRLLSYFVSAKLKGNALALFAVVYIVSALLACIALYISGNNMMWLRISDVFYKNYYTGALMNVANSVTPYLVYDNGLVAGIINTLFFAVMLLFPVVLLAKLSLYYTIICIGFCIFFAYFLVYLQKTKIVSIAQKPYFGSYLALITAYLAVQTTFEPDYGSVLRHLMIILPVFIVFFTNRNNNTTLQQ